MAFNFLSKLVNRPENIGEDDKGSPVDDVAEEIGEESDAECDGEEDNEISIDLDSDLDLNLNSSDDDGVEGQGDAGFAWSDQLHNVGIGLFTAHKGPKLEDLDMTSLLILMIFKDFHYRLYDNNKRANELCTQQKGAA